MKTQDTARNLSGAVVGTGHLGRHHTRILNQHPEIDFLGAFDADPERLDAVCGEYGAMALSSLDAAKEADLVIVATPTIAHYSVARELLEAGCHVMLEKPITQTMEEARALIELADANSKILAVGHVEFYNPAVQASLREAGPVRYMESQRLSPFTSRSVDVDVILSKDQFRKWFETFLTCNRRAGTSFWLVWKIYVLQRSHRFNRFNTAFEIISQKIAFFERFQD